MQSTDVRLPPAVERLCREDGRFRVFGELFADMHDADLDVLNTEDYQQLAHGLPLQQRALFRVFVQKLCAREKPVALTASTDDTDEGWSVALAALKPFDIGDLSIKDAVRRAKIYNEREVVCGTQLVRLYALEFAYANFLPNPLAVANFYDNARLLSRAACDIGLDRVINNGALPRDVWLALLHGVFLDHDGRDKASRFAIQLLFRKFAFTAPQTIDEVTIDPQPIEIDPVVIYNDDHDLQRNAKNHLQERCVQTQRAHPVYELLRKEGPDHSPMFFARCSLDRDHCGIGRACTLANAEKAAAYAVLQQLRAQKTG